MQVAKVIINQDGCAFVAEQTLLYQLTDNAMRCEINDAGRLCAAHCHHDALSSFATDVIRSIH